MKSQILLLVIVIVFVFFFLYLNKGIGKNQMIVVGTGNPGKIILYQFTALGLEKKEINTSFKFVYTVRIGDIFNDGRNVIVAGVSNSFFGPPFGCKLIYLDPVDNFKINVIDNVNDIRCKDVTIGDLYNDGRNEIVLGTHGEGLIKVYHWNGTYFEQKTIENNFIDQADKNLTMNHLVPVENLTYNAIDQSAVHIVRIADVDGDGKNEILATISSPLEYHGKYPEIGFLRMYRFDGNQWNGYTIDNRTGVQLRSILATNFKIINSTEIFVGGSPHLLFNYQWNKNGWNKTLVDNESVEKNMKGLASGKIYNNENEEIVLATGYPDALIYSFEWTQNGFEKKIIANVSETLGRYKFPNGIQFNSLDVQIKDVYGSGRNQIIVVGEADMSGSGGYGWEATNKGFLIIYQSNGSEWTSNVIITDSILGMDIGKL